MVYLLLFVGLVFSISIGAFLWGKLDPEVKAANAEYEKSLANLNIEKIRRGVEVSSVPSAITIYFRE